MATEQGDAGRPERLLAILNDDEAIRLLAAWPHIKRRGVRAKDGGWGSVTWDTAQAASVSGMATASAARHLQRLRDLDLILPDGTRDPVADKALRALIGQRLAGNSRR